MKHSASILLCQFSEKLKNKIYVLTRPKKFSDHFRKMSKQTVMLLFSSNWKWFSTKSIKLLFEAFQLLKINFIWKTKFVEFVHYDEWELFKRKTH